MVCACVELLPGAAPPPGAIGTTLAQETRAPPRVVVLDRLPRADTGKVFKHRLLRQLAALGDDEGKRQA